MTPGRYDFTIWIGNDRTLSFAFKTGADGADDLDLTGSTMTMYLTHGGGRITIPMTITDAAAGEASAAIPRATTRALTPLFGGVRYEIERSIAGAETTLLYGTITLSGGDNSDA